MNDRLRRAIARIDAGEGRGTGSLVAANVVLTALHVVGNRRSDPVEFFDEITVTFPDHVTTGVPIDGMWNAVEDWALIRIAEPPRGVLPLPLAELADSGGEWITYGFPDAQPKDGMVQSGRVRNHLGRLGGVHAYQLFSDEAAAGNGAPVKGLSGGPVLVEGGLVGVMRFALMRDGQAVAGTLYACPSGVAAEAAEGLLPIPDPCHGLPGLPHHSLPERPFRYLEWFTAKDAAIFFGRSREIRQMYDRLIDDQGASLILLYGQSGVGKSSFLDAGLVPRLGWTHDVFYLRRDPGRSLLESLREELVRRASDEAGTVPPWSNLDDLWRAAEDRGGRPLVVFLDQVEEVYTRRRVGVEDEMAEFCGALVGLQPRGKLVLGFRKEWFPEIHKQLEVANLDFARVFLESLDRDAIVDAVTGLTRTKRTRERYGLTVEESLPEMIARDLLADPDSPVAPTLQILLTKLWERATAVSATTPTFTVEQYIALRKEGTLLADFLERQEENLEKVHPEAVESGLTLDILVRHTTHLLTSKQCEVSQLTSDYAHVAELDALLTSMRDNYLLVDSGVDDAGNTRATRLAHDTLAPCVRAAFEESARPGQRARRIIDGRAEEWEGGAEGRPLDAADLGFIESGFEGTRAPTADESRMLEASREARDRRESLVRTVKGSLIALAVALLIAMAWAWNEKHNAETNLVMANAARNEAELSHEADVVHRLLATRPTDGLLVALYAAGQSAVDRKGDVPYSIQASLNRAMEFARESTVVIFQREVNPDPTTPVPHIPVFSIAHHPTDDLFLCGLEDGTVREFTHAARQVGPIVDAHPSPVVGVAYLGGGDRTVSAGFDGTVRFWRGGKPDGPHVGALPTTTTAFAASADGSLVAVGGEDGVVRVITTEGSVRAYRHVEAGRPGKVNGIAFTDESPARFVVAHQNGELCLWSRDATDPDVTWTPHEVDTAVLCVAAARAHDGRLRFASGGEDETVRQYVLDSNGHVSVDAPAMREHDAPVTRVAFRRTGRLIASSSERVVVISNLDARVVAPTFTGPSDRVSDLAFGGEGVLVIASHDGTARVRDPHGAQIGSSLQQGEDPKIPVGDGHAVGCVAFSRDGKTLVSGSREDQSLCVWEANGTRLHRAVVDGGGILDLAFAADGKLLLGCMDGRLRVWDLEAFEQVGIIGEHDGQVTAVEVAETGGFVTGDSDGNLHFWHPDGTRDGEPIEAHPGNAITDIAITPDGEHIVTVAAGDTQIRVWRRHTKDLIEKFENDHQILSVAITSDGERVISGSEDGFILVRDIHGHVLAGPTVASASKVDALALSADDKRLVSGGDDGVVRLWGLELSGASKTARNRPSVPRLGDMDWGHYGQVKAVAIHDRIVASGGSDGATILWQASWRDWFRTAVERLVHHPSFEYPDPTFDEAVKAGTFARERVWEIR